MQLTLVLGLLLLVGCGAENSVQQCRPVGEQFLRAMSQGKYEQAHEVCDNGKVSLDDLKAWAADPGNMSMLKGYTGVEWETGGQYTSSDPTEFNRPTVRTPENNKLQGRPDVTVQMAFRMEENGKWVIIGFAIKSGK